MHFKFFRNYEQNNSYLLIKKYFGSKDTNYRSDGEVKWTPSLKVSHLFPGRKLFLSHKEKSEENPMGPLDSLSILLVSMNLIWVSKTKGISSFFVSRKPLSRKGKGEVRAHSLWGPFCGLSILYAFGERELGFQNY